MINGSSLAVAVLLTAASASPLLADDFYDPFTGLPKGIYYGTLDQLHQQGLPMSKRAEDYMKEHQTRGTAVSNHGDVFLLEDRGERPPATHQRRHRKAAQ